MPAIAIKNFAINCPSFVNCVCRPTILRCRLRDGKVPTDWKRAVIKPIYKSGKRTETNNYRPINLTSIISKTIEHIICTNMWWHINNYEIIKKNQHSLRKSLNTNTQLLHVMHKAAEAYEQMICFDFSKAFDRVPHNLLIFKLKKLNFNQKCISWIEDWLLGRSSPGVPQGCVLGPLPLIPYIKWYHW